MIREIDTPHGLARAHVDGDGGAGTLVLGHGAGGGVESADLVEITAEAAAAGWRVVRVEQPWRVAGKRIAVAPHVSPAPNEVNTTRSPSRMRPARYARSSAIGIDAADVFPNRSMFL